MDIQEKNESGSHRTRREESLVAGGPVTYSPCQRTANMFALELQCSSEKSLLILNNAKVDLFKIFTQIRKNQHEPFKAAVLKHSAPEDSYDVFDTDVFANSMPLVVMQAYREMYDSLKAIQEGPVDHLWLYRLFYIGHPGIGKTIFLLYALARFCQDDLPVAVLASNAQTLFYLPPRRDEQPLRIELTTPGPNSLQLEDILPDRTVILCDSNTSCPLPPRCITGIPRPLVVAASPKPERWDWARKDCNQGLYYVPLPSKGDIQALAHCLERPGIERVYSRIGPCLRQLVEYCDASETELTENYTDSAVNLVGKQENFTAIIRTMGSNAKTHPPDYHQFFYMVGAKLHPKPRFVFARPFIPKHVIGTSYLLRILRQELHRKHIGLLNQLLASVTADSDSTVFGVFFEAVLLNRAKQGQLKEPYFLLNHTRTPLHLPTSDSASASPYSGAGQALLKNKRVNVPILDKSQLNYFIEVESGFPTVDGVIITPKHVQLLQLTVASRYTLYQSGLTRVYQFVEANRLLQGRQWHFIFITPNAKHGQDLAESGPAQKLVTFAREKLALDLQMSFMTANRVATSSSILEYPVVDEEIALVADADEDSEMAS